MTAIDASASDLSETVVSDRGTRTRHAAGSKSIVGLSIRCTNSSHSARLAGQQKNRMPSRSCLEACARLSGRKYAKSGDMLPIIIAASGSLDFPSLLNGNTAAACEIVNGMRGILAAVPRQSSDQLWHRVAGSFLRSESRTWDRPVL